MSSRYPPTHDSRYAPRARSRSPPRYQEWRPSGPSNAGFSNRHTDFGRGGPDPPRGPKTFNDPIRGPPGAGTGPAAPLGPRGRGAPPRPEFRELRDAPPLGTERSFRERDFDRRSRPASPRLRSPPRNFREGPPPRDLDIGRPRRDSRDGPLPMGFTYPDQPPFGQPGFGRGSFGGRGRGRGRGDFDFRDSRNRRGPIEDRSTFRPRDRSPPPRWSSISRPDREDWRPERREEDRWIDRDDRERDADRFRKDSIPASRFESRIANEGPSRTITPHQHSAPSNPPPAEKLSQPEQPKDDAVNRRFSTNTLPPATKGREPLPPQADLMAGRAESSTAKYGSRTSSPPPSGPQVPAFGSFLTKPSVYSGPTSNVWKAAADSRPVNNPTRPPPAAPVAPTAPVVASPVPKTAPTAPKAQLNAPPPAAPRAPRALEVGPSQYNDNVNERVPAAPKSWNSAASQPAIPTAPWALRNEDRNSNQFTQPPSRDVRSLSNSFQSNTPSVPVSPRMSLTPVKPLDMGPSPSGSAQSQATVSESGARDLRQSRSEFAPPRSKTPPLSAPSGPRRTHSFSTSPTLHSPNIPTAPKAIRGPPVAPRVTNDRGLTPSNRPPDRGSMPSSRAPLNAPRAPAWNQWIRPGAPVYRDPTVPAKRDSNGEEKAATARPRASPGYQSSRRASEASSVKAEDNQDEMGPKSSPAISEQKTGNTLNIAKKSDSQDHDLNEDAARLPQSDRFENMQEMSMLPESFSAESSDDGMELDEEDFAQSKAKFERQKAHLESQLIKLDARQYRAVTPLEQIARLARVSDQDLNTVREPSASAEVGSIEDEEIDQPEEAIAVEPSGEEDQQELLTPKREREDPEDGIVVADSSVNTVGAPVLSTEAIHLPYLAKSPLTPLSERGALQETITRQNACKNAVMAHLEGQAEDAETLEMNLRNEYLEAYRQWQIELQSLDHDKDEDERQMSADPGPDMDTTYSTLEGPTFESSRSRLKFSSEYDIQKVLKESEETARIEQERLDRESRKIQADMEKEAVIPDVYDEEMRLRRMFKNNNRFRSASQLTEIFGYEPPHDTFTDEEHKKFLVLFKDRPKKWGEIAAQLPGRTYADCIHHYYAFKWDGRFRETKSGRRKGKGGRGRGSKAAPRIRGSALMADLSRTDEDPSNPPAFTETGRPRRAATRTTTYGERDAAESKGPAITSALGKKSAPTLEPGVEKPAKRRKATTTGERGGKRGRQPLAAAPIVSPVKYDKEALPTKEEIARAQILDEASLLTGLQAGRRGMHLDSLAMFAQENLSQTPNPLEMGERPRHQSQPQLQRSNPSSYWSVPEQTDFIKFISHFGTDFAGIAAHMGTKTQTMVKNHYLRLIEGGSKPELVEAANLANARREAGENMGLPPTPTPITKRRYDNPPTLPRSLTSHTEFMEIDDSVMHAQPSMQLQAQASQYPQPPRFMTPSQPAPTSQRVVSNQLQGVGSPVPGKLAHPSQSRSNPPPGPKMGFFSESRLERRPTASSLVPPQNRPVQQALQIHAQQQQEPSPQPTRLPQEGSIPSPEFMENLEREKARAMTLQAQALHERISQERMPQQSPHQSMYQPIGLQHPRATHTVLQDRRPEIEERPATPGLSASMISRQGQSMFRNVIGSPAPVAPSPIALNPSFRPGPAPSPPKRDESRPGSVPAPSPAQSIAHIAPPSQAEPRKTSNVMSLLNSEPAEPRPAKGRMNDQSNAAHFGRAQSPAPQSLGGASSASILPPRREVYSQTPVPRAEFDRSYTQSGSHVPPPTHHERVNGGTITPGGSRQDWATRPPTSQPPLSSSPHPPTPLITEARPYYSHHRSSILGGLNSQSRHNPSPPPSHHPYMHHSRTPSLNQAITPVQGQTQGMQQVQQQPQVSASQASSSLQANPYGQLNGSSSHIQQIQAQQQNHMRHAHNASVGPGMQRRQINPDEEYYMARDREAYRRDEQFRQDRAAEMERQERQQHMDRQREQEAHFQAQQREHHYAAQYLQGPPPLHPTHSHSYPQSTGLSLREQSAREADASLRDAMHREGQIRREGYQADVRDYDSMLMRRRQEEEDRYRYEQMRDSGYQGARLPAGYPHRR